MINLCPKVFSCITAANGLYLVVWGASGMVAALAVVFLQICGEINKNYTGNFR